MRRTVANIDELSDDYFTTLVDMGINSIAGSSDPVLKCPPNWRAAMKSDDKQKWLKALYDHLEKCYTNGTYGIPTTPPPGASVIPPVIVLKHLLKEKSEYAAMGLNKSKGLIMKSLLPVPSWPSQCLCSLQWYVQLEWMCIILISVIAFNPLLMKRLQKYGWVPYSLNG